MSRACSAGPGAAEPSMVNRGGIRSGYCASGPAPEDQRHLKPGGHPRQPEAPEPEGSQRGNGAGAGGQVQGECPGGGHQSGLHQRSVRPGEQQHQGRGQEHRHAGRQGPAPEVLAQVGVLGLQREEYRGQKGKERQGEEPDAEGKGREPGRHILTA